MIIKSKKIVKGAKQMSEALTTAISTAFTNVKSDVLDIFETAAPIGLVIMGVGLAIGLGVKFFKKIAK